MNAKKIMAIVFIWIVVALAWALLGGTISRRTGKLDEKLTKDVAKLWGEPQVQSEATVRTAGQDTLEVPIAKSEVTVKIDTKQRKRGLLWFAVYEVSFSGSYTVTNDTGTEQRYTVHLAPPKSTSEFSSQQVAVDGTSLPQWTTEVTTAPVAPGKSTVVTFSYVSSGTDHWRYDLPAGRMINDLTLTMKINSPDYDFAPEEEGTSPPNERPMTPDADGNYMLVWNKKLVSNARDIFVKMPQRQQPGPLVKRICWFAPVCLFFFFVVMVTIQIVKRLQLHPMHYLFLSAAFFAFHLLMAYMVDHVNLHLSFWISAAASVFLVVMYLWMVAGAKTAILYAGLSQLVYLVLFSYAFFLEGFTGLTITIASVVTLAALMILTAKVKWGATLPELEAKAKQGWAPIQVAEPDQQPSGVPEPPAFMGENNGSAEPPPAP